MLRAEESSWAVSSPRSSHSCDINFGRVLLFRNFEASTEMVQLGLYSTKLRGLSPRANHTDRVTAACRRSYCQLLLIESATWSAWRIPTVVISVFYTGAAAVFQVAPQLYSRDWVDPLRLKKSSSSGNRTRTSGSVLEVRLAFGVRILLSPQWPN
jgi:hypothetical protein